MNPQTGYHDYLTRRWFLKECAVGLGTVALHALLQDRAVAAPADADPLAPRQPHFPAKAKNVIYLFMAGGPSHLELFDNKPALARYDGKLPPPELLQGYRVGVHQARRQVSRPEVQVRPPWPVRHGAV